MHFEGYLDEPLPYLLPGALMVRKLRVSDFYDGPLTLCSDIFHIASIKLFLQANTPSVVLLKFYTCSLYFIFPYFSRDCKYLEIYILNLSTLKKFPIVSLGIRII